MTDIIEVNNLHYTYEDGTKALRGINLNVKKGERLAIMGPNGSGKSTFFLHLNGILKPTAGCVLIDGKKINYARKGLLHVRKMVGIVFQNPDDQLFSASVKQEIAFGILNLGVTEEEAGAAVDRVMKALDITSFAEKPTHFLSGGEKKRVSIADVLVMDPSIILFDEPTAALDPKHAERIDQIIDELSNRGITVILSTHDVNRALSWADRLVIFHRGEIVGDGAPEQVLCNEGLLAQANLKKPAVLRIFETLCQEGILEAGTKLPHDIKALEDYIRSRKGA